MIKIENDPFDFSGLEAWIEDSRALQYRVQTMTRNMFVAFDLLHKSRDEVDIVPVPECAELEPSLPDNWASFEAAVLRIVEESKHPKKVEQLTSLPPTRHTRAVDALIDIAAVVGVLASKFDPEFLSGWRDEIRKAETALFKRYRAGYFESYGMFRNQTIPEAAANVNRWLSVISCFNPAFDQSQIDEAAELFAYVGAKTAQIIKALS